MNVLIDTKIKERCPDLRLAVISCDVQNSPTPDELWNDIKLVSEYVSFAYTLNDINKRLPIAATRKAYKSLGKDPNRYRPSSEALCRRIVKGLPLYRINTLVDIVNLVSIRSAYSIGGFDYDKIEGSLTLGVGRSEEDFDAIGRGKLNIEGLPVYRDAVGGVGTPTSDNERTKITDDTKRLLMIINAYSGEAGLTETVEYTEELLKKYAYMTNFQVEYI